MGGWEGDWSVPPPWSDTALAPSPLATWLPFNMVRLMFRVWAEGGAYSLVPQHRGFTPTTHRNHLHCVASEVGLGVYVV